MGSAAASVMVGGSTSVSAVVWIPLNLHLFKEGLSDSRDEAPARIRRLSGRLADPELLEVCVDVGIGDATGRPSGPAPRWLPPRPNSPPRPPGQ
jgi:hypothetical protein